MKPIVYAATVVLLLVPLLAAAQTAQGAVSLKYVEAQEALAADNFAKAKTALAALASETTGDLQTKARAAANTADIQAMRIAFRALSDVVIKMAVPAGYAVAFCPMYMNGSSWLQKVGGIANPYFGKSMLSCGEFKK